MKKGRTEVPDRTRDETSGTRATGRKDRGKDTSGRGASPRRGKDEDNRAKGPEGRV